MTQRRTTYIKMSILIIISIVHLLMVGHPQTKGSLLPDFDVIKEELIIPLPLDRLKVTVDSIINALDEKIAIDPEYYHSNNFNYEERDVIMFLMMNSHLLIDGWFNGSFYIVPTRRLENISEYYDIRDWYKANKTNIDWYYYVELAMEDMGYHLKRDSTGVYVERDSTILPPSVSKINK